VLQVLGGIALGLIALFSSYDHITLAGPHYQQSCPPCPTDPPGG
jgi:hypothetical protein